MLQRSELARVEIELPQPTVSTLDNPALYTSRELSWLDFNDRVLEEALDARNPVLERLKFIAIYGTNLDEYFMIRVAAIKQQIDAEVHRRTEDGRMPAEHLAAISERLRVSVERYMRCLHEDILPEMEKHGIRIVPYAQLSQKTRADMKQLFDDRVFPVLTPLAVDPGHPFPYISNLSLSLAVELEEVDRDDGARTHFARVKVPGSLPRLVPIEDAPEGERCYLLLEDLIAQHLDTLFPGLTVRASYCFRVTRDADLDLQEDEADDLLAAIESELRKRRFGEPVRLEIEAGMPEPLRDFLLDALDLQPVDCYENKGILGTSDLWALVNLDYPELHDPPFQPAIPRRLLGVTDLFAVIREGDVLLHHPYESFDPVVQFVRQAANDPQVLAIKQTLYRTTRTSPVVQALVEAAENGKQVAVLIELKARFDEENNIHWARDLERAGVHVAYGLLGLKTHSKVTLIVRDEPEGIRRYVHFGTGNYNDRTARTYTDLSLFTCRPEYGSDVTQIFNFLTGFSKRHNYKTVLVAPVTLRKQMLHFIEREAEHARAGRPARIVAKLNAISDGEVIRALYRASQAGVDIELIVRGMCVLRPGIPGISDRIRVRSIVGRFLEHSRIYFFENGGQPEVYIGSADWMGRNLDRRVETVVPVLDPELRTRIKREILDVMLADDVKSRVLQPDGTYVRAATRLGEALVDAQQIFLASVQAL